MQICGTNCVWCERILFLTTRRQLLNLFCFDFFFFFFRLFGFVARKQGSTTDNASHLFAELDPDQPASAIVSFVSKTLNRWKSLQRWRFGNPRWLGCQFLFFGTWLCPGFFFSFSWLVSPSVFPLCLAWFVFFGVWRLRVWIQTGARGCVTWRTQEAIAGVYWHKERG